QRQIGELVVEDDGFWMQFLDESEHFIVRLGSKHAVTARCQVLREQIVDILVVLDHQNYRTATPIPHHFNLRVRSRAIKEHVGNGADDSAKSEGSTTNVLQAQ